jgi:hypothetical protein
MVGIAGVARLRVPVMSTAGDSAARFRVASVAQESGWLPQLAQPLPPHRNSEPGRKASVNTLSSPYRRRCPVKDLIIPPKG